MSVRSLLLGLDVSPRRMGWGLVDLVTGEPVACGCEPIDLPDHGWSRNPVARGLGAIEDNPSVFGSYHFGRWSGPRAEVQAVYVECPISRFPGMAYDEGRAIGTVHAEVERRWPHAPVEYLKPGEWKKLAGLKGNASKPEVLRRAHSTALAAGWSEAACDALSLSQDAADALLVAIAGQRRNGENWDRAVERGAA